MSIPAPLQRVGGKGGNFLPAGGRNLPVVEINGDDGWQ